MSSYTPELCRALIDALDTKIRDAVDTGITKKIMKQEREAIVSYSFIMLKIF